MRQLLEAELLKLDCGSAVKLCECMKNHRMVHFFLVSKLYFKKAVKNQIYKNEKLLVYEIYLIRTL